MRYMVTRRSEWGVKRAMLVEHLQDPRYKEGIVCYLFRDDQDGPAAGAEFFDGCSTEQVMREFEETHQVKFGDRVALPDQVPGCDDDWVHPVRGAIGIDGSRIPGVWEKLENGQWIRISAKSTRS